MRSATGLLAVALLLAGCSGDDGPTYTITPSTEPTPTDTTTAPPPPAENRAPAAVLEASTVTGAVPLNVTFRLFGTDPDGDNLTWTLGFGDGSPAASGSSLPSELDHAFTQVGNFTVAYAVTDGSLSANRTLTVAVGPAGSPARQTKVITGTTVAPFPGGSDVACIGMDVDGNRYDLAPARPGWTYFLVPGDGSYGIYWYKGGEYVSTGAPRGTVPSGMDEVEICNLTGLPNSSYTLTLKEP